MLELEQAVAQILGITPPPQPELVSIYEAHRRFLIGDIVSPIDLPCFDNSAMDGYAVRVSDLVGATAENPARLQITGKIAAGENFSGCVEQGTCVRVFTGSLLPMGADAVIMQEDTGQDPAQPHCILANEAIKPWENVRFKGEDVKKGAILVQKGERLGAGKVTLLAAAGISRVTVGRKPRIGLLATGSELREPGAELGEGQIYESNRAGLMEFLREAGARPKTFPLVPDKKEIVRTALESAFNKCDAVITSGGVSVGELDLVKSVFEESGGELQFWRVAMKPGRPFVLGSREGKLLFGLPGNPASALLTFLLLVRPSLLRWQGAINVSLPSHPGVLAESFLNDGSRRHFLRVRVDQAGNVFSAGKQASHILNSIGKANGLIDLAPDTKLQKGAFVPVLRFEF